MTFDESMPLVSCVCPTTESRAKYFPKMLDCYNRQTYPNRELVISVPEGENIDFVDTLPYGARVVYLSPRLVLGAKRNATNAHALGSIIAHFDDDDWSAPQRLAVQVNHLIGSGLPVVGLRSMKFTDGFSWYRYIGDPSWPLGTSLVYQKSYWEANPFPCVQTGSDSTFTSEARRQQQCGSIPADNLMYATIHAWNTSVRTVNANNYETLPAEEAILHA